MLVLTIAIVVITCWYTVRFEGDLQPFDPLIVTRLSEVPQWQSQPLLLQNVNEPAAVYIVPGVSGSDGLFEALRLDVRSGSRSSARIRFGPDTAYVPFDSAEVVGMPSIELHGLSLPRPTFHLLTFPGGGGPGFHLADSDTGVVHVVVRTPTAQRTLLTRTIVNSSGVLEMRSQLWSDRARRLAAFLSRETAGWTLYLFALAPTQAALASPTSRF